MLLTLPMSDTQSRSRWLRRHRSSVSHFICTRLSFYLLAAITNTKEDVEHRSKIRALRLFWSFGYSLLQVWPSVSGIYSTWIFIVESVSEPCRWLVVFPECFDMCISAQVFPSTLSNQHGLA